VQIRIGEEIFAARARILSEETDFERVRVVQELSRRKYGWGDGLVVELIPGSALSS
jgi:hypothetical protein